MAGPSKIEQAEANVAVLQAALDEAQRVLHAADEAQKRAEAQAERMRKATVVLAVTSGAVVLVLQVRHRRLQRAHRRARASVPTT